MKKYFKKTLDFHANHLLFQAHSHHSWPDMAYTAMHEYEILVQQKLDDKWSDVFNNHIPRAQKCVSRILNWPYEKNITFGSSTFELLTRLFSSVFNNSESHKILTTSHEYHSARRLIQSMHHKNICQVTVSNVSYSQILKNLEDKLEQEDFACCFLSQSFYQTGYTLPEFDLLQLAKKFPKTYFIFDCYHSFAARNLDWATTLKNVALIGGGYKYAMSGEGCCFLAVHPDANLPEPLLNGWMAEFSNLSQKPTGIDEAPITTQSFYKFLGATFDPVGIYRMFSVWEFWQKEKITPQLIKNHVQKLQENFKAALDPELLPAWLFYPKANQGNFLSLNFKTAIEANKFLNTLKLRGVFTDARDTYLRFGFGPYIDEQDVLELTCQINPLKAELLKVLELAP